MKEKENLFPEFEPAGKEDWLKKVEKDLKGKAIESLNWQLSDSVQVSAFAHPEDQPEAPQPLQGGRLQNSWLIGEAFSLAQLDEVQANLLALKALAGGAEALRFDIPNDKPLDKINLPALFKGVHLNMISCHFTFSHSVAAVKAFFNSLLKNTDEAIGSFGWEAGIFEKLEGAEVLALVDYLQNKLPDMAHLRLDGTHLFKGTDKFPEELAGCVRLGQSMLSNIKQAKSFSANSIQIGISIGTDYLAEIAKLRALKILWANLLKAYGLETNRALQMDVQFAAQSLSEDMHENMIQAATQAMSAVIGGAQLLYVSPADAAGGKNPSDFTRRIARNVQHLLKMESYLDRVLDPAAGSYYIEGLTKQFAEAAWELFVKHSSKI